MVLCEKVFCKFFLEKIREVFNLFSFNGRPTVACGIILFCRTFVWPKVSKEDSHRPPSEPCHVSATPTNALRALVNSPCLGDADTHAPRMCQFPSTTRNPTQKSGTSSEVPLSFIKISLFFRGICVWLLPRVCLRARMPRFLRGSSIRKWQGYKQRVICPLLPPHRSSFRERKAQVRP